MRRWATDFSTASPTAWPSASLTALNWSRSAMTTEGVPRPRSARAIAAWMAASTARRLPRPVSGSRVAARVRTAAIRRISNSAITWAATSRSRPSCTESSVPGRLVERADRAHGVAVAGEQRRRRVEPHAGGAPGDERVVDEQRLGAGVGGVDDLAAEHRVLAHRVAAGHLDRLGAVGGGLPLPVGVDQVDDGRGRPADVRGQPGGGVEVALAGLVEHAERAQRCQSGGLVVGHRPARPVLLGQVGGVEHGCGHGSPPSGQLPPASAPRVGTFSPGVR